MEIHRNMIHKSSKLGSIDLGGRWLSKVVATCCSWAPSIRGNGSISAPDLRIGAHMQYSSIGGGSVGLLVIAQGG
jgi:hypothetical protein